MKRTQLVAGEYYSVGRATSYPVLLLRAHNTPLSHEDIKALLKLLSEALYMRPVYLTISRSVIRGRGGFIQGRPSIILPYSDSCYGTLMSWHGKIRAGLVLHEYAHVLTFSDWRLKFRSKPKPHGPEFVSNLDRLLLLSEGLF